MHLHKYDLSGLQTASKLHWNISNIQPFFPSIEKLFKTESLELAQEYGIHFLEEVKSILSPTRIRTKLGNELEIHRKTTMLVSPYKWMSGSYGSAIGLPNTSEHAEQLNSKLQSSNNAGYVGAIVSAALSESGCIHFPKVYGVFTGFAASHDINISDDYGSLSEKHWFSKNIGTLFDIHLSETISDSSGFRHTRSARDTLAIGDDTPLGTIDELDTIVCNDTMATIHPIFQQHAVGMHDSDSESVSTEEIFDIESCACEDVEDEDEDDEGEPFAWAVFKNVPVQTTLMERCVGTLYELCMLHSEPEKHMAWIAQVMFALAFAQRTFSFTHNDLHANNIMYVPYNKEFLYYNCNSQFYKVPTYGFLIKIIDFERGIASIRLNGMREPKVFMSDHYHVDEEASGMFNYGEFYNPKYTEIKPNPSCDLVRLATSMYWDFDPESPVSKLFEKWMVGEKGNVLFGKKNPKHDRYHGFDLYKAIVRYCKHAVPRQEISALHQYKVNTVEGPVLVID